jgi:SAM-dependent methyltransferase
LIPLRFGPAEHFDRLRVFLEASGYTEEAVCERLGLGAPHEVLSWSRPETAGAIRDTAGLLAWLFLAGGYAEPDALRRLVPAEALDAMGELGLLAKEGSATGLVCAPVVLYPVRRLYIASDRWTNPDGSHFTPQADIVYPAITRNTRRFLGMLPEEPCRRFLDLCSGTGIAALAAASRYAERAWAVDITERATRFAEFNRLLNGADNVTVLQGDLYEPLGELSFDRIVAHPPYLPSAGRSWVFQDAGAEGEEVTRRIVAGLAAHLSPGGKFYCLALGVDREGQPLENRVRGWLGEHEPEFDVLVAVVETHTPEQIASQPLLRGEIAHQEFAARRAAFEQAGIEDFVYGLILVQRHPGAGRRPFTVRRQIGARTGSAEIEWAIRWESTAASAGAAALLLEARPARSKNLEVQVVHRVKDGMLEPQDFTLQTEYPFRMESRVHPWTAALIEACDGARTGRELHGWFVEQGLIPRDVRAGDFARFLGSLISGGFLEIEGHKPPAAC